VSTEHRCNTYLLHWS